MHIFSHLLVCALSAGHELPFFYILGILDARKDDYIGGTYNVLITVLIGVFDNVDIYTTEFILNIKHALLSMQAARLPQRPCALPL